MKSNPTVIGRDGLRGILDPTVVQDRWIGLVLDDGRRVWIDRATLSPQSDGSYQIDLAPSDVAQMTTSEVVRVPVVQEFATVQKRVVEGEGVRVTKRARERVESVSLPVVREQIQVERVPVQQFVASMPEPRQEGSTYVVPVVEEVVVVEKRLFVREEVRITKSPVVDQSPPRQITLRSEEVQIERVEAERPSGH